MEDEKAEIERLRLEFEREKWQAELKALERDAVLREREQANRDAETEFRRSVEVSSKWSSPLVVAVFAAAIAGLGNAGVTALNGWLQRDLEERKGTFERGLEESKAESTRVLEMIKTGGTETAAKNISFLLEAGLIADVVRAQKLEAYLAKRLPGTGPSLPAPTLSRLGAPEDCGNAFVATSLDQDSTGMRVDNKRTAKKAISNLADRVITVMERKGFQVDRGPGEVNIVYVEGMEPDGTPNANEENEWNDVRMLIRFQDGKPVIVASWAATTEPGRYWTQNPLTPLGVARIEFGQYKAWQVGMQRESHEALVQTGGEVTVSRDQNKDGRRVGDRRQTGVFGLNQHWGYDLCEVDKASAGSLVGQSKDGHRQFMALVKSDPRYQADRKYVFTTTILPASDIEAIADGG
jgi:hypothetical protein